MRLTNRFISGILLVLCVDAATARPTNQSAAVTYQGLLKQSGAPINGNVDLQFALFDAATAGNAVGAPIIISPVSVTDGVFTTEFDFGALAFNGDERWLEIGVCSPSNNGNGPFTTLGPRQKLAAAPYSAYALNAALGGSYANSVSFSNPGNSFVGSHVGNGSGLTNLNPSALSPGSAPISITGNAATATSATTAGNVSGTVAVGNGGTGATTAAGALTNLNAQQRVVGSAPAGSYIRTINADGTVVTGVDANSGGDITDVLAGAGLSGGATSGSAALALTFGVSGTSTLVARADHVHNANEITLGSLPASVMPQGGSWPVSSRLLLDAGTLNINPVNNRVSIGTSSTLDLAPFWVQTHNPVTYGTFISEGSLVVGPHSLSVGILSLDNNSIQAGSQAMVGSGPQPDELYLNEFGGSVGIGTTAPEAVLHVFDGSAGAVNANPNSALVVESTNGGWISILTPDGNQRGILFGDTSDPESGGIVYDTGNSNGFQFRTGGNVTHMVVDGAGNVGIGTGSPSDKLDVAGITATDGIRFPDGSLQTRGVTILRATSGSFNTPALAGGASTSLGVIVSGATVGSVVTVSPLSDLGNGIVVGPARVTTPGNVVFYIQNISNAVIDPPASQFTIAVTP